MAIIIDKPTNYFLIFLSFLSKSNDINDIMKHKLIFLS